jgi:hypothetical protein
MFKKWLLQQAALTALLARNKLLALRAGLTAVALAALFAQNALGQIKGAYFSGEAMNGLLSTYRTLTAQGRWVDAVSLQSTATLTIDETPDSYSIQFNTMSGRGVQSLSASRVTRSVQRSPSLAALVSGTKSLDALQTRALLSMLLYASERPSPADADIHDAEVSGDYTLNIAQPSPQAVVAAFGGYRHPAPKNGMSIICESERRLRYDVLTGAVTPLPSQCF